SGRQKALSGAPQLPPASAYSTTPADGGTWQRRCTTIAIDTAEVVPAPGGLRMKSRRGANGVGRAGNVAAITREARTSGSSATLGAVGRGAASAPERPIRRIPTCPAPTAQ